MANNDGPHFARFYDAEQREYLSANDFSAAEIARRPWKAFWPPRSDEGLHIWRHCEFPEVLSWRFDVEQPFDQPWRTWLQSLLMKDEEGSCRKKYAWVNPEQGRVITFHTFIRSKRQDEFQSSLEFESRVLL